MSEEFDLHAALTGRQYPEATVPVWMDDSPWYELERLEKKHAGISDPEDPELKVVEDQIENLKKRIEGTKWQVGIRGISPRAGEDIISAALHEIPVKRDMYGRDEFERERLRNKLIRELSFAAHLTKIINPGGGTNLATDENRRDMARLLLDESSQSAIETVDKAIGEVSKKFTELQARQQSPDFL